MTKTCPCGSGEWRGELYDARGIFCAFICDHCEAEKRLRYRPEIFLNPKYWADEDIEED